MNIESEQAFIQRGGQGRCEDGKSLQNLISKVTGFKNK